MSDNLFCSKCGTQNSGAAQFCQNCGGSLWPSPAGQQPPPPGYPQQPAPMQAYAPQQPPPAPYAPQPAMYIPEASPYGGFWMRLLAHIIDHIILSAVALPLYFILIFPQVMKIINDAEQNQEPSPEMIGAIFGAAGLFALIVTAGTWLYDALLTSSSWQGTIGKRVLRLKVVDEQGHRISFGRATGRFFSKIVSGMIMYIGFIMIGFTDRKRGLHDMMAGTLVRKY